MPASKESDQVRSEQITDEQTGNRGMEMSFVSFIHLHEQLPASCRFRCSSCAVAFGGCSLGRFEVAAADAVYRVSRQETQGSQSLHRFALALSSSPPLFAAPVGQGQKAQLQRGGKS